MTLFDFLNNAGPWQWFGLFMVVAAVSSFRPITINRCKCDKDEKK